MNKTLKGFFAGLLAAVCALAACACGNSTPPEVPPQSPSDPTVTTRRLFFDDLELIASETTAERRLNEPVRIGTVIRFDDPWQGDLCDYFNILTDTRENGDPWYRMYYLGRTTLDPNQTIRICYAESDDGEHWTCPKLGLRSYEGSAENNILLDETDDTFDNFYVFKDTNPECPDSGRYKAVAEQYVGAFGLRLWTSPDGIRWTPQGILTANGSFDSLNTCRWESETQEYVMYVRYMRTDENGGVWRSIRRLTSKNFRDWDGEDVVYEPNSDMQMYTNNIERYYRAPQYYIGFPTRRYDDYEWSDQESLHKRLTDEIFMASRDGVTFRRFSETWIGNRPENGLNWVYGDSYASANLVTTKREGIERLSFYLPEDRFSGTHTDLARYDLRLDGFVSFDAGTKPAKVTTTPIAYAKGITLNFKTTAAGSVKVVALKADGSIAAESLVMTGDFTDRAVAWKDGIEPSGTVSLRFELRDAKLYSYAY